MIQTYKADTAAILFQYVEERDTFFEYSDPVTQVSFKKLTRCLGNIVKMVKI
jgi:hypothetical protein